MANKMKLLSTVAASLLLSVSVAAAQSSVGSHAKPTQGAAEHGNNVARNPSRGHSAERPGADSRNAAESKSEMGGARKSSTTGQAPAGDQGSSKSNAENTKSESGASAASEQKGKAATSGQASPAEAKSKSKSAAEKQYGGQAQHRSSKKDINDARKSSTTGQAQPNEKGSRNEQNAGSRKPSTSGQANERNSKADRDNRPGTNARNNEQTPRKNEQAATRVKGAKLDRQQVQKVQRTVLARRDVNRVTKVNFSINVGTAVPSHVHLVAVPSTLVEVYPAWRNAEYFVTRDEIVIVDHSRRIVAVLPANSNEAASSTSTTVVETSGPSTGEAISISELSPVEIREVQTVLIRRGYLHGRVDGVFGPETRDALVAFQRKRGLQASGRIDVRTVSSLGLSGKITVGERNTRRGAERGTSSTTGQAPSDSNARGRMNNNAAHERQNANPRAGRNGAQNEPSTNGRKGAQNEKRNAQEMKGPNAKRSTTGQGSESEAPNARPSAGNDNQPMPNDRSRNDANGRSTTGQGNSMSGPRSERGGDNVNKHNPARNRQ